MPKKSRQGSRKNKQSQAHQIKKPRISKEKEKEEQMIREPEDIFDY